MVSHFHSSFFTDAGAYESWANDGRLYGGRDNGSGGGGREASLHPNIEEPVKFRDFVDLYPH